MTKKIVTEKIHPLSGDLKGVEDAINEFKKTHKVIREYLSLQIMMLPQKPQDTKIVPINQQQLQLQPVQMLNAILIYEDENI